MVGNGRRARDEGKETFRAGVILCVAVRPLCDEPASGEETRGRDMAIVAVKDVNTCSGAPGETN